MTTNAPLRRRLLLPLLVMGFILISVAEVWLLTAVGSRIGVPWTLAILVAEALVGSWLMRREGRKAWAALSDAYATGKMPTGQLADAALVLVGGIMLILPGPGTNGPPAFGNIVMALGLIEHDSKVTGWGVVLPILGCAFATVVLVLLAWFGTQIYHWMF